ncbi:Uncharacterised protein [Legionella israelensis]|uniref:Uncharacterized protein n=1 Tax=Legionella israelensis TaxID=454 RepID=A0A0W0VHH2_9GAMM|nr:hypothetical protein [Legionella israelensis]KTD19254.1 hypothetical protein Lisr_2104 [Legionella israelensis]QBS09744.1 hypothetical protein E4T55_07660 [Legionella israelensis]SCY53214.1 hypothetical protein SAMN02746069_02774 [Legionella israelensis DSM 19235]STX59284.1 Uncharacterised protein [Legionella israelensis]
MQIYGIMTVRFFFIITLTETLGLPHQKAKIFAEAIANKDPLKEGYRELALDEDGDLIWQLNTSEAKKDKNIFQKLLHDADCLDIIRARDRFDGKHLDFYKNIASSNNAALKEMGLLIAEARSLIELEGDARRHVDFDIKKNMNMRRLIKPLKKIFVKIFIIIK